MPELPEVEGFKRYLEQTSLNKKIIDVVSSDHDVIHNITFATFKKDLIGQKYVAAHRKGKYLIIDLSNSSKKLVMHFGLTGTLSYTHDTTTKVPYSRVIFIFSGDTALHWSCKRKIGKLWLVNNETDIKGIKELGIDALAVSEEQFTDLVHESPRKNIKSFLMDQTILAGIGNEYSDEILFQAGVSPQHVAGDLSKAAIKKIYTNMIEVLTYAAALRKKHSMELSTTTFFSKVDRSYFKRSYLQAHRHEDMICPKDTTHRLQKITVGGRTAYYCPEHQT